MPWRLANIPDDLGREFLVRSPDLVDPDWHPNGICMGTLSEHPETGNLFATCARWNVRQDTWEGVEIFEPFEVREVPK